MKRTGALYDAIRDPITDLRIRAARGEVPDIDAALFRLELRIWKRVEAVLENRPVREGA